MRTSQPEKENLSAQQVIDSIDKNGDKAVYYRAKHQIRKSLPDVSGHEKSLLVNFLIKLADQRGVKKDLTGLDLSQGDYSDIDWSSVDLTGCKVDNATFAKPHKRQQPLSSLAENQMIRFDVNSHIAPILESLNGSPVFRFCFSDKVALTRDGTQMMDLVRKAQEDYRDIAPANVIPKKLSFQAFLLKAEEKPDGNYAKLWRIAQYTLLREYYDGQQTYHAHAKETFTYSLNDIQLLYQTAKQAGLKPLQIEQDIGEYNLSSKLADTAFVFRGVTTGKSYSVTQSAFLASLTLEYKKICDQDKFQGLRGKPFQFSSDDSDAAKIYHVIKHITYKSPNGRLKEAWDRALHIAEYKALKADPNAFYKRFFEKYDEATKGWKKPAGFKSKLKALEKSKSVEDCIALIFKHAHEEPKSRAAKALRETISQFSKPSSPSADSVIPAVTAKIVYTHTLSAMFGRFNNPDVRQFKHYDSKQHFLFDTTKNIQSQCNEACKAIAQGKLIVFVSPSSQHPESQAISEQKDMIAVLKSLREKRKTDPSYVEPLSHLITFCEWIGKQGGVGNVTKEALDKAFSSGPLGLLRIGSGELFDKAVPNEFKISFEKGSADKLQTTLPVTLALAPRNILAQDLFENLIKRPPNTFIYDSSNCVISGDMKYSAQYHVGLADLLDLYKDKITFNNTDFTNANFDGEYPLLAKILEKNKGITISDDQKRALTEDAQNHPEKYKGLEKYKDYLISLVRNPQQTP